MTPHLIGFDIQGGDGRHDVSLCLLSLSGALDSI